MQPSPRREHFHVSAATDTDGTIGKVEFFQGTTLLGTVTSSPYIFNWTGVFRLVPTA